MINLVARLILATLACAHSGAAVADSGVSPKVLNLMANKGIARMVALSDDAMPQRINNSRLSAQIPVEQFARILLHFEPERLDVPGRAAAGRGTAETSTVDFATALFTDEWTADIRGATDAFARRELTQRWHARIQNMEMNPRTTLRIFWPVTLIPSRYDFDTETFPVYGNAPFKITDLPTGGAAGGVNCIQLDRSFELPKISVSASEAEAFISRNQNTVAKGNSAAIFVGLQITVIGMNEDSPAGRRRCDLKARVESIKGFDYVGVEAHGYREQSAVPGETFGTWYQRGEDTGLDTGGDVSTPFHARETVATAAAEAKQFKLRTSKDLVLIDSSEADRLALANLETYADFLFMGAAPELFTVPTRARCVANQYLSDAQKAAYFEPGHNGQWRGANEFEVKRYQQAFVDTGLPQILRRAVAPPRRFLIVNEIVMPRYDFQNNGFLLNALNPSASFAGISGPCSPDTINLGSGDYIDPFWSLPPAEAEALLLSLPPDRNTDTRRVYLASEVELGMLPGVERIPGRLESAQVPVISRLKKTTLYADRDLRRPLFSPRIYATRTTVLEAGLPTSATISQSYAMDYGTEADMLRTLKVEGELTRQQWSSLAIQQLMRDEAYTLKATRESYRPGSTLSLDETYTPFFPWRFRATGGLYEALTKEQKILFEQWSRMQAEALP